MNYSEVEQKVKITVQSHKCLFMKISDFYDGSIGDVVRMSIGLHDKVISFIALVKKYHRTSYGVNIPEFLVKKYNICRGESVNIKDIHKIKPISKEKRLITKKNKIDLLSLIPKRTRKNAKIYADSFLKEGEEWIRVWNPRVIKQPELYRYVDLKSFGLLLGQLQAEGVKFQNNKTPFLSFTNVLISEHNDFIKSLKVMGVNDELITVQYSFNPKRVSSTNIENYKIQFTEITGIPVKTCVNQKRGYYKFRTYVYSSLLTEIILGAMNNVRKILANSNSLGSDLQNLAENFLAKLLTGDGTLKVYKDKRRGSHNISGKITDKDLDYRNDYARILQKLGFKTRNDDINVHFSCGIKNLIFLYRIKAFKGTRNWDKILRAIEIHCKGRKHGRSLLRLTKLTNFDIFSIKDLYNLFNQPKRTIQSWLFMMNKRGYIRRRENQYLYTLTKEGKEIGELLNSWSREFCKTNHIIL